jgi:hypothetical protein
MENLASIQTAWVKPYSRPQNFTKLYQNTALEQAMFRLNVDKSKGSYYEEKT